MIANRGQNDFLPAVVQLEALSIIVGLWDA